MIRVVLVLAVIIIVKPASATVVVLVPRLAHKTSAVAERKIPKPSYLPSVCLRPHLLYRVHRNSR